jgi:hypothetical protein
VAIFKDLVLRNRPCYTDIANMAGDKRSKNRSFV